MEKYYVNILNLSKFLDTNVLVFLIEDFLSFVNAYYIMLKYFFSDPPWTISVIKITSHLFLLIQALMRLIIFGCLILLRMFNSSDILFLSSSNKINSIYTEEIDLNVLHSMQFHIQILRHILYIQFYKFLSLFAH